MTAPHELDLADVLAARQRIAPCGPVTRPDFGGV